MRPSQRLRDALVSYHWPGNVRELENVVKRYVILQDDGLVLAELERAPGSAESPSVAAAALAATPTPEATPIAVAPMAAAADPIAAAPFPAPMPAPVAPPPPMAAAPVPAPRRPRRAYRAWRGETADARATGRAHGRARSDLTSARAIPLEPPQGRQAARRELQDAPQQDEGVRHQRVVLRPG